MHKLLKRQLKKIGASVDKDFLELVNQAYIDADEDRTLLEHSLSVSSQEMRELYNKLEKNAQEKLQDSEDRYTNLVYELRNHYFFYAYDTHYKFIYLSDSVYNILGYTKEEGLNTSITLYFTNDKMNANVMERATKALNGEKQPPYVVSMYHKDGSVRYLEIDSYPSYDKFGNVVKIEGIARDTTIEYEAQQKLNYISNHDTLTGVSNRYSLTNKLEFIIADSARNHKTFALMYIDLDEFKNANDTLGHSGGDILLQEVVKRVQNEIRQNDVLARIGGDEFVIVFTDVAKKFITTIAQNILKSLHADFVINKHTLKVSVSIGISIYPKDGEDIDSLLKNADTAMYKIKNDGKNNFAFF